MINISNLCSARTLMNLLGYCLVAMLPAVAQSVRAEEHGLKAGQKAPEFRLKSADGTEVALTNLLARGKVALVFYRSADW
jgi:hypothetical protein